MTRVGRRTWCAASALVGCALLVTAAPIGAQSETSVGLVLGGARTAQQWQPEEDAESIDGYLVGAFVDVVTPARWLGLRAEGTLVRRGGDAALESGGQPAQGRIRVDYLSVAVHLKILGSLGPLDGWVVAGPTLDQPLRSRLDPVLSQALDGESPVIFALALGGGLGAHVTDRIFLGIEARLTEGMSDAHTGAFTSVRNRSTELMLRAAVPLSVLRGR